MSDVEEEKEEIPTQNNPIFESKYSINSSHNYLLEQFEKDKNGIVSTDMDILTECKHNKTILDIYYNNLEFYPRFDYFL